MAGTQPGLPASMTRPLSASLEDPGPTSLRSEEERPQPGALDHPEGSHFACSIPPRASPPQRLGLTLSLDCFLVLCFQSTNEEINKIPPGNKGIKKKKKASCRDWPGLRVYTRVFTSHVHEGKKRWVPVTSFHFVQAAECGVCPSTCAMRCPARTWHVPPPTITSLLAPVLPGCPRSAPQKALSVFGCFPALV